MSTFKITVKDDQKGMLQDALRELQGSIQFEIVELANSAPEIHEINVQNVAQE